MIGFTFNNKHSSTLGVIFKSQNRTITPAKRKNQYYVTGKDGYVDYGDETFENRFITVDINLLTNNMADLRAKARDVAYWLSGSGNLIFDDESDKAYVAKVFEAIDLEQLTTTGKSTIVFECEPFAQTPNFNQVIRTNVSPNTEIKPTAQGTQDTPCIIIIKNTGTIDITNIEIQRKAGI